MIIKGSPAYISYIRKQVVSGYVENGRGVMVASIVTTYEKIVIGGKVAESVEVLPIPIIGTCASVLGGPALIRCPGRLRPGRGIPTFLKQYLTKYKVRSKSSVNGPIVE
ncbi:hypothetical protein AVEN_175163-1 [Araneus ventricosus]|uniref:Uncharacterized protein n=1 Tax=Araneus ventricosus TaxID=182803 RepID=A0A4Y2LU32_ARAVE|nr:hypothetical protein AVEN_175163-1 [Araneus ventricosus]